MADVTRFPANEVPELLVGPFQEWRVVVDGRAIPGLTGYKEGDITWLTVDHRFSQPFKTSDDAHSAAVLIAQAMAIASGYSHLGAETKDQSFAPKATRLDGFAGLPDHLHPTANR
jgi:hypothetical protein